MVSSLDGFVSRKDNSISWFETRDHYEEGAEYTEQQTNEFLETIDCYVMGARTYEQAAELSKSYGWPYGNVPTIVMTHKNLQEIRPNIEFFSGDLNRLWKEKLEPNYRNIWVVGGPELVNEFLRLQLVHEIRVSILPVMLGQGIPFFKAIDQEQALHLKNVTAYKTGIVELLYQMKKE